MAITHFEITELPDSNVIDSKIDGVLIVAETKYPIANQNLLTWDRKTPFHNKTINTAFKFKVHDDVNQIASNEALGNLKWVGVSETPASENVTLTILNNDVVNLLEELPLNDAVEFIFISSMTGVQNLSIKNASAYISQKPNIIDLFYSNFTAEDTGGGDPYFLLEYLVGKNGITEATVYNLLLKIISLAVLNISDGPTVESYTQDIDTGGGVFVNYTIKREKTTLEISLGYAHGVANVDIVINSPFLSLNAYNAVFVNYNGDEVKVQANTTINANITLDKFGKGLIVIDNYIVEDTADPKNGNVTITLNSINTNPALVDGTQEEELITAL